MTYDDIVCALKKKGGPIKAWFIDDLMIYIVREEAGKLIGAYALCAKNRREYIVPPEDIERIEECGNTNE